MATAVPKKLLDTHNCDLFEKLVSVVELLNRLNVKSYQCSKRLFRQLDFVKGKKLTKENGTHA